MIYKAVTIQVKTFVLESEHICYIGIPLQQLDLIILSCYALTENVDDKKKNGFYNTLERIFNALPKN